MNYLQLRNEVKRLTGRNDAQFDDRVGKALNRAVRSWTREFPCETCECEGTVTHQGGNTLVFPEFVDRVVWLADVTNKAEVPVGDRQWDRTHTYSYLNETSGNAVQWEPVGYVATLTGVTGYLEGRLASNSSTVPQIKILGKRLYDATMGDLSMSTVIDGFSPTNATGLTTTGMFLEVDSIHIDAPLGIASEIRCQGNIVAIINPFENESRYYKIRLVDKPAAGTVFKYRAVQRPALFKNDYAAAPVGIDSDYLIWEAASDIYFQLKEDDRGVMAKRMADKIAQDRRSYDQQFGDWSGRAVPEDLT
ncbi:MAG: hypothetical protein WC683_07180 [bacterium]